MEDLEDLIYQLQEWSDRLEYIENEIDNKISFLDQSDDLELMTYNNCTDISTNIHADKWELRQLAKRLEEVLKNES